MSLGIINSTLCLKVQTGLQTGSVEASERSMTKLYETHIPPSINLYNPVLQITLSHSHFQDMKTNERLSLSLLFMCIHLCSNCVFNTMVHMCVLSSHRSVFDCISFKLNNLRNMTKCFCFFILLLLFLLFYKKEIPTNLFPYMQVVCFDCILEKVSFLNLLQKSAVVLNI